MISTFIVYGGRVIKKKKGVFTYSSELEGLNLDFLNTVSAPETRTIKEVFLHQSFSCINSLQIF